MKQQEPNISLTPTNYTNSRLIKKEKITEAALLASKDLFEPYGAIFEISSNDFDVYHISFTLKNKEHYTQSVYIKNMSEDVSKQYIICCVYELAAKLFRKIYPIC